MLKLFSLIAHVGQTRIQALHLTHFSVSILKPKIFLKPRAPITAPTGQKYLHHALFSVNSRIKGNVERANSVALMVPGPAVVHIPRIGHIEQNRGEAEI
ncbi:hypothetical protein MA03_01515 [Infirmifilum uzonense]|uniref:Uncharacterized protein n=1 Tax=Infirmifilum uzonense TaxID=1550241 RepID=A0A0F7FGM3_9CREN|nr:hypothetical protein MA03_01515 [Infirmifilum uzonense]